MAKCARLLLLARAPNESRFLGRYPRVIGGYNHGFGSPVCRYPVA